MLAVVTFTGADDSVNPEDLIQISKEFPFVEWGILIGSSVGVRFPSLEWIRKLVDARLACRHSWGLSLHICGKFLREIMAGHPTLIDAYPGFATFDRCQLNFHGEDVGDVGEDIMKSFCLMSQWDPQIIFQFDRVNEGLLGPAMRRYSVAALFDESHGAGVLPRTWRPAIANIPCGYAGGLGPDNIAEELKKIDAQTYPGMPYWVDMETKLFTNRMFDLGKCRSVLEQVLQSGLIGR